MKAKILAIFAALVLCSCQDNFDMNTVTPSYFKGIAGKISDSKGEAVEHIKVTVNIEGLDTVSAYTSSEGIFIISIDVPDLKINQINLVIEDIDGEDFGGHYATIKDTVQIDKDSQKDGLRLSLDYRLTLSTASEYNPQA